MLWIYKWGLTCEGSFLLVCFLIFSSALSVILLCHNDFDYSWGRSILIKFTLVQYILLTEKERRKKRPNSSERSSETVFHLDYYLDFDRTWVFRYKVWLKFFFFFLLQCCLFQGVRKFFFRHRYDMIYLISLDTFPKMIKMINNIIIFDSLNTLLKIEENPSVSSKEEDSFMEFA